MTFTTRRIREEKPLQRLAVVSAVLVMAMRVGKPLLTWYKHWKERELEVERERHIVKFLKKTALVLVAVLCSVLVLAGTVKALVSLRVIRLQSIFSIASTPLPADAEGHTNFLLLGTGDKDHEGIDLTDTMIVASIDPGKTKSAVMLSLPRDLYVLDTKNMGKGRINSLYRDYKVHLQRTKNLSEKEASTEALRELANEIGERLHIQIHHIVKVDFSGFVDAVDALGGVDLEVPYDINDQEYPGPNYSFEPFIIKAGMQHLDGETALKYARSRHTTSDFGRSARQQQLLRALADKAKSAGIITSPSKVTSLLQIMSEHVETSMGFGEMMSLAKMGTDIQQDRVITMQLNDRSGYGDGLNAEAGGLLYAPPRDQFEGASVLLPISIPLTPITWKQIETLSWLLFHARATYLARPPIAILNAGGKAGLGRKLGNELLRFGFNVQSVGNASSIPKRDDTLLAAQTPGDQASALFFSTLLKLPTGEMPADLPPDQRMPVTIILGKNFEYTMIQDLLSTAADESALEAQTTPLPEPQ